MALRTELKKTLTDTTPLFAVAGAGDLVVEKLAGLPHRAGALPVRAQTLASGVGGKAGDAYVSLAGRGKDVVARIRRQQPSRQLDVQAKETVRRTKAAATTGKRSAAKTGKATSRAAKAAATTATTAVEAAEAGISEIG